jgi:hypothetical protein
VIRPNELTNPGERAAYARVEALFEQLDRFSAVELSMMPAQGLDPDARTALLDDVDRLADRLGRGDLLDTALEHARESVLTRFVAEFRGRYGGFSPTYDPKLQAAAIRAISDAVAVAVVEDQLPTADAEALAGAARTLLGRESAGEVRAEGDQPLGLRHPAHASHAARRIASQRADLADEGRTVEEGGRAAVVAPVGAPSELDWAEADHGATVIDPDAPPPGSGSARTAVALVVAAIGVPVAAVVGVASGGLLLAIAAGAAVAALAWSFWISGRR